MAKVKSLGYTIELGKQALAKLQVFLKKHHYSSYYILCDENTLQHCLPILITNCPLLGQAHIMEVESGEMSKDIDICRYIWQTLNENLADRETLMINLGGGVVSDLGGFCASVYKRGIDFINIPTSLLAMADASVGGKTGIDFNNQKNLLGTFTQPKAVFIFPDFLKTLPQRHHHNGLAEIYKIALIADAGFWRQIPSDLENKNMEALITRSVVLKNRIVMADPLDKNKRKLLNFGHTIGHAVESAYLGTTRELLHGEAVVVGMMVESNLAMQKKLITKIEYKQITETIKSLLPPRLPELNPKELLLAIKNDKKSSRQTPRFSLPDKIGSGAIDVLVSSKQITSAITRFNADANT